MKTDDSISMTDHTSFEEMTHFKIDGKKYMQWTITDLEVSILG